MALKEKTKKYLTKYALNSISGKTIVITGGTSGIGLKALEELLYLKANIILAARDIAKAEQVKKELEEEYKDSNIEIYELDISDLESIKRFSIRIKRNKIDIYGFVNNAGILRSEEKYTKDGYPIIMGTNYIGTYNLIERLKPYFMTLDHDVKLINMTSLIYKKGKINYNDFLFEKDKKSSDLKKYSRSKLCVTKYSIYLANTLMDTNIQTIMTHPGVVKTKLVLNMFKPWYLRLFKPLANIFQTTEKGALSIPYALTNNIRSGCLVGPTHFFNSCGEPKVKKVLNKKAYQDTRKLITFTESILKNKDI